MKRKIFSVMAIAAIALVSCNKEEENTTELGEATISGNVWAELDQTNQTSEGVNGMQVSIEVNTQNWDQQPVTGYNYDQKVYETTTNSAGDYTLTVPATDDGYNVTIRFEDLYTTMTNGDGTTTDVLVTRNDITKFVWNGANISTQDQATVTTTGTSGFTYGTATIYGTIFMNYDIANWNAAPPANQKFNTASNQTQQDIVWKYNGGNGPNGVTDNTIYTASFDFATGDYMITFPTEGVSGANVTVDWGFLDFQGTRIQNNMAFTADSTVNGIWSVGGGINNQGATIIDGDLFTNYDINFNFNPF